MGFFGEISGMRDVFWACFWCALDRFGRSETCWGYAFGMPGGPLEVPWDPLGVSWEVLGHPWNPGSVLGSSWGALGVILEVWGDPGISPGISKCYYFGWALNVF